MNAHSDFAIRRLEFFAVPGLTELPYDAHLEQTRRRKRSGTLDASALSWGAMVLALVVLSLCLSCEALCHCLTCDADFRETLRQLPAMAVLFVAFYLCGGCYEVLRCWREVRSEVERSSEGDVRAAAVADAHGSRATYAASLAWKRWRKRWRRWRRGRGRFASVSFADTVTSMVTTILDLPFSSLIGR